MDRPSGGDYLDTAEKQHLALSGRKLAFPAKPIQQYF